MAMNGAIMATEVVAAIKTVKPLTAEQEADALATWTQICNALVAHTTTNGAITIGFPIPVQVTPATGTGGTTAVGTGTIT